MEKTYKYGKFEIVVIKREDRLPNEFWAQVNIPEEVGWGSDYEFILEDSLVYLIKRIWEDQENGGLAVAVELATALVSLGLMPANFQINDTTAVIEGTWYFGYSDSYEGSIGIEKVNSVSYIPIDNLEFDDEGMELAWRIAKGSEEQDVDFDKAYDAWEASWIDGPQW